MMVLYMWLVPYLSSFAVAELTLLKDTKSLHCVASGYTDSLHPLLTWDFRNTQIYPSNVSEFSITYGWKSAAANSARSLYNLPCDVPASYVCGSWNRKAMSNLLIESENELGPVLDYRWSALPFYVTNGDPVYRAKIMLPKTKKKVFHISLQTNEDAFIIMYNKDPHNSGSYWFIVDGWKHLGYITVLRKCPQGVPSRGDPMSDCQLRRTQYNGTVLKKGSKWAHLTVILSTLNDGKASIFLKEGTKTLIEWIDDEPIDVQFVSFRTKVMTGYWRFHMYNAIQSTSAIVSSPLVMQETRALCLSFTFHVTQHTVLHVHVMSEGTSIYTQDFRAKGGWQTERIQTTLQADSRLQVMLEVTPSSVPLTLGAMRVCDDNEIFVSTFSGNFISVVRCEEINKRESIQVTENANNLISWFNCTDGKMGSQCNFKCEDALNSATCSGVVACNNDVCSCLPGYRDTGCEAECPVKYYGPNCENTCPVNCDKSSCDAKTGGCVCKRRYIGRNCDMILPQLLNAPSVIENLADGFILNLKNLTTDSTTLTINSVRIEYRLPPNSLVTGSKRWQHGPSFPWPPQSSLTLHGLHSNTNYQLRAVLVVSENHAFTGLTVLETSGTTSCVTVDASQVKLDRYPTILVVDWREAINNLSCPLDEYSFIIWQVGNTSHTSPGDLNPPESGFLMSINGTTNEMEYSMNVMTELMAINKLPIVVNDLEPNSEYTFSLSNNGRKYNVDIRVGSYIEALPTYGIVLITISCMILIVIVGGVIYFIRTKIVHTSQNVVGEYIEILELAGDPPPLNNPPPTTSNNDPPLRVVDEAEYDVVNDTPQYENYGATFEASNDPGYENVDNTFIEDSSGYMIPITSATRK